MNQAFLKWLKENLAEKFEITEWTFLDSERTFLYIEKTWFFTG